MLLQHDPLSVPASSEEIKATWLELMQFPIVTNDGNVFQFDRNSRELMEGAVRGMHPAGLSTISWRLNDNTDINIDQSALQEYLEELKDKQAIRGFIVDQEYLTFKQSGPTRRELENWKMSHTP